MNGAKKYRKSFFCLSSEAETSPRFPNIHYSSRSDRPRQLLSWESPPFSPLFLHDPTQCLLLGRLDEIGWIG